MKLTLQSMMRASFELDKLRADEGLDNCNFTRLIVATREDKIDLHASVERSNAVLFNDSYALRIGTLNDFLGFTFVEPDSEEAKGVGKRKTIIDGFTYIWEQRRKK